MIYGQISFEIRLLYKFYFIFRCRYLIIKKYIFLKAYPPQSKSFERRICAKTRDLKIFKKFSNESKRSSSQHGILSSTTLHSRSAPLIIGIIVKAHISHFTIFSKITFLF